MNKKKPSRNYEEINKEGIELFANSRKYNQITGFKPIGETKEFFDEMKAKDNQVKEWLQEKAERQSVLIDLQSLIRELLQAQKEELKGEIEKMRRVESDKAIQGAIDGGFNVALQEVLNLFK